MKKLMILCLMIAVAFGANAQTKRRTPVKKTTTTQRTLTPEQKVLGKHMLSLQWISWDYFGTCNITKDDKGVLHCKGEQLSRENDDYLKINGTIEIVDANNLKFTGTIAMKIYHINGGKECLREGTFDFKATNGRKYWRMQQMDNPCDMACDYVDIYFKK